MKDERVERIRRNTGEFPGIWTLELLEAYDELVGRVESLLDEWEAAREAGAKALEDAATTLCDRNAEGGLTHEARHFGKTYARLLRERAAALRAAPPTEGES